MGHEATDKGLIYVGIDVGVSGGVCILHSDKGTPPYTMQCSKTEATPHDMAEQLLTPLYDIGYPNTHVVYTMVEKVHSMPKQGVASTFKFGQGYGIWIGILSALRIPYELTTPRTWMGHYGAMPKEKKDRKNYLKSIAQSLYPEQHITLATADAVLMAHYLCVKGMLGPVKPSHHNE